MEKKVEVKFLIFCPCCNKNVDETSLWIDEKLAEQVSRLPIDEELGEGRVGRIASKQPCIDCWNREMGFFEAKEEKAKTKNQRILEEDEKDMHTGEGDDSVEEMEDDYETEGESADEELEEEEQEDEEENDL